MAFKSASFRLFRGKWGKPALIVIVLLIIAASFLAYNYFYGYRYRSVSQGIEFLSNEAEPGTALQWFGAKPEFMLVLEGAEQDSSNAYNIMGMTMFNLVLNGNGRNTVVVAKALGTAGELLYCNTNEGDVRTNKEITAEECAGLLESQSKAVVYFHPFNDKQSMGRVVVSSDRIDFYPKQLNDPNTMAYLALNLMYGNVDEIIGKSNNLLGQAGAK